MRGKVIAQEFAGFAGGWPGSRQLAQALPGGIGDFAIVHESEHERGSMAIGEASEGFESGEMAGARGAGDAVAEAEGVFGGGRGAENETPDEREEKAEDQGRAME